MKGFPQLSSAGTRNRNKLRLGYSMPRSRFSLFLECKSDTLPLSLSRGLFLDLRKIVLHNCGVKQVLKRSASFKKKLEI
jgi:hypothetical protein